jgi:ribonuclease E
VAATPSTPISNTPQIVSAAVVGHDDIHAKAEIVAPVPRVVMPAAAPAVTPIKQAVPAHDIGQASDAQQGTRPTMATAAPAAPVVEQPSKSADVVPATTLNGIPEKPTGTSPIASLPLPKQGDLLAQPVHPSRPAEPSSEESKPLTAPHADENSEHKSGSDD